MSGDLWFERLAEAVGDDTRERAPARLKSKIYSALLTQLAEDGPLLDLKDTKHTCGRLCIFEQILTVAPRSTGISTMNPCRICHARVLGETMDHAPIFWPGCPYSEFHNG
jgi:hypothetical protein